jgi:sporulation protein YlmC with PRC-barrel domain
MQMHLVHDLLDKQLIDEKDRRIGKVDSIVLSVGEGAPRVAYIETGWVVLGRRIGPNVERFVKRMMRSFGVRKGEAYRIDFDRVVEIALHARVRIDTPRSDIIAAERAIKSTRIGKILGA